MHKSKGSGYSRTKVAAAGAMLLAASTAVSATEGAASDWEYGLAIYGWLPSISGELNYSPPGSSDNISVDAEQIIDSLKMTFQGSFEARKGPWSAFTDVIYLDLGGSESKSATVPDGTTRTLLNAQLDITGWIWTLGGSYSVWQDNKSHLDLLAGARMLSLDTEVTLTGGGPGQRYRNLSEDVTLWDGIVGAKGQVGLNDRWYLPYYFDVGTGDTDLTWQAMAGVGYEFDWGQVDLTYRYLEYDQGNEELLQDIGFGGVKLGVGFRF